MTKLGLCAALTASVGLTSGCAAFASFQEGEITKTIEIEGQNTTFDQVVMIDTNEIPEVRDNRDKIIDGTFKVRSIRLQVENIQTSHMATLAWGRFYIMAEGETFPEDTLENADAGFEAVPITEGQEVTLDVSPAHAARMANTIFTSPNLQAKIIGETDVGPVDFSVKVVFEVEFEAGL